MWIKRSQTESSQTIIILSLDNNRQDQHDDMLFSVVG